MSHLDAERLALIAVGEPPTAAEHEHLRTCDVCSLELAELEHTVAIGRSTVALGELEAPPDRVWDGILDEIRSQQSAAPEVRLDGPIVTDAPVVTPPAAAKQPASRRKRRGGWMLFALAASIAAVLAVVGMGVWNVVRPPQAVQIASATLDAFPDHPGAAGTARVTELSDGERTLTVKLDDSEKGDGYREVWLITADASALVSLGELDGRKGTFVVPDDVDLRDYVLVDISQEPLDGDPDHSGDSIVRGQLEFS